MVSSLSQEDVSRLAADASSEARAALAQKLGGTIDSPALNDAELELARDIARLMARDVEVAVRRALAESLRHARRLPHDVAFRLADDVEAVALPILTDSGVLTDADLIELVRRGSPQKQEAIARRDGVSEPVSAELIASAVEPAVTALLGNATARISDESLGRAIDRFGDSEPVKETMAHRERLPATVSERLVVLASERLKEYLVSHHEMSPNLATDIILQSRERALLDITAGSTEEDLMQLVAQMHQNHRLTPFLVLRAVCMGDMVFFEAVLATMAGIPLENARRLIRDAGQNGLRQLYLQSKLPERLYPAVRVAVGVVLGTEYDGGEHDLERYRARVITRVLTQFEDFPADDLAYLLDRLGDVLKAHD